MLLWLIYLVDNDNTYLDVNVKCLVLIRFEFSRQSSIKFPGIEFPTNPSSGSRADA